MASRKDTLEDTGRLLLRLVFGGMMLTHGVPKLLGFADKMDGFPDPIGLGSTVALSLTVFAEVLCAGLVTLGAFTRLAVVPLVITMAVAAFVIHADDPLGRKELALVYLGAFLAIGMLGAGRYSLDSKLPARFAKLK
jgi:putative oxidoreductase